MRLRPVLTLLVLGLLFLSSALAQGTPKLQLCVADLQANDVSIATTAVQNALIKFFAKQKYSQLETVPLKASLPNEAMAEAREKKCDYVVTTNVAESHSDSGNTGGWTGVNLQTFYVTVAYKLDKVSDGAEQSSASFKASDRGSAQNAVIATMKKIAERVTGSIKK